MLTPFQMRAPSKRLMTTAGILVISLAALAWSFKALLPRGRGFEGAPALAGAKTEVEKRKLENNSPASADPNYAGAELIDSDNDGVPDVAELRTFQDRDNFRRWFTAISEIQYYQLSDQWNAEQRDCAGLARKVVAILKGA